ncbi:hypothetical protein VP01_1854g1 [Puccinia sorghi]|uniref:Uncharacterized protein n=1 Tax=Puccinia sorghi TaxID=27349 RepID=A0A0L6VE24_9BASI|nr:hypothetical protein VP01_1854g1 [Puccinia sorghi]
MIGSPPSFSTPPLESIHWSTCLSPQNSLITAAISLPVLSPLKNQCTVILSMNKNSIYNISSESQGHTPTFPINTPQHTPVLLKKLGAHCRVFIGKIEVAVQKKKEIIFRTFFGLRHLFFLVTENLWAERQWWREVVKQIERAVEAFREFGVLEQALEEGVQGFWDWRAGGLAARPMKGQCSGEDAGVNAMWVVGRGEGNFLSIYLYIYLHRQSLDIKNVSKLQITQQRIFRISFQVSSSKGLCKGVSNIRVKIYTYSFIHVFCSLTKRQLQVSEVAVADDMEGIFRAFFRLRGLILLFSVVDKVQVGWLWQGGENQRRFSQIIGIAGFRVWVAGLRLDEGAGETESGWCCREWNSMTAGWGNAGNAGNAGSREEQGVWNFGEEEGSKSTNHSRQNNQNHLARLLVILVFDSCVSGARCQDFCFIGENVCRNLVVVIRGFWGLEWAFEESWVDKGCCGGNMDRTEESQRFRIGKGVLSSKAGAGETELGWCGVEINECGARINGMWVVGRSAGRRYISYHHPMNQYLKSKRRIQEKNSLQGNQGRTFRISFLVAHQQRDLKGKETKESHIYRKSTFSSQLRGFYFQTVLQNLGIFHSSSKLCILKDAFWRIHQVKIPGTSLSNAIMYILQIFGSSHVVRWLHESHIYTAKQHGKLMHNSRISLFDPSAAIPMKLRLPKNRCLLRPCSEIFSPLVQTSPVTHLNQTQGVTQGLNPAASLCGGIVCLCCLLFLVSSSSFKTCQSFRYFISLCFLSIVYFVSMCLLLKFNLYFLLSFFSVCFLTCIFSFIFCDMYVSLMFLFLSFLLFFSFLFLFLFFSYCNEHPFTNELISNSAALAPIVELKTGCFLQVFLDMFKVYSKLIGIQWGLEVQNGSQKASLYSTLLRGNTAVKISCSPLICQQNEINLVNPIGGIKYDQIYHYLHGRGIGTRRAKGKKYGSGEVEDVVSEGYIRMGGVRDKHLEEDFEEVKKGKQKVLVEINFIGKVWWLERVDLFSALLQNINHCLIILGELRLLEGDSLP